MKLIVSLWVSIASSLGALGTVHSFLAPCPRCRPGNSAFKAVTNSPEDHDNGDAISPARRVLLSSAALASGSLLLGGSMPAPANAAVGTLPEFADSNAIIQGLTVNVADKSQQDGMIDFLVNGFDFQVLRKRIKDSVEETVGFRSSYVSGHSQSLISPGIVCFSSAVVGLWSRTSEYS
jgi:hypothetical protein